jgi:2-haloacid dehalogenase
MHLAPVRQRTASDARHIPHLQRDHTGRALSHAVAEAELSLAAGGGDKLMDAYNGLDVFPDVPESLKAVEKAPGEALIFSNGTDDIVSASVKTSPHLQPYAAVFKGPVTVDGVKVFKPDRRTYRHLLQEVGKQDTPGDVWLITANPFDVVGASAAGLKTAWIDRAGKGWVDRLGDVIGGVEPTVVTTGVDKAIEAIVKV